MKKTITISEMRRIENAAVGAGVPSVLLMENAARGVLDEMLHLLGDADGKTALFFCGEGNNGGDGLAAARLFAQAGGRAVVYCFEKQKTPDSAANRAYCALTAEMRDMKNAFEDDLSCDIVCDALFGTGLSRMLSDDMKRLAEKINRIPAPVVAVDIPSGMNGDTGEIMGACVRADVTVTFHRVKQGLYLSFHRDFVGRAVVCDIGLPAQFDDADGILYTEEDDLPALLPKREVNWHKGDCGRVVLQCGSMGMAGAACMAAMGAVYGGAGLVTLACPHELIPVMQTLCPNAMCVDARSDLPACDAMVIGCGLGQDEHSWWRFLHSYNKATRTVVDADALNMAATHQVSFGRDTVLTPHLGEAARLLSHPVTDKLAAVKELYQKYGCTVMLKSDVTLIHDGTHTMLNVVGTPALAKGGSGDALAGITGALLCHLSPFDASVCASLWLGTAAKKAEQERGNPNIVTQDVLFGL